MRVKDDQTGLVQLRNRKETDWYWIELVGGGYFVGPGQVDIVQPRDNTIKMNKVFIYPDLEFALVGTICPNKSVAVEAFEAIITDLSVPDFRLFLSLINPHNPIVFDSPSNKQISRFPLRTDHCERANVYVSQSKLFAAGEGLFSVRQIDSDTTFAFFNGVRKRNNSVRESNVEFSDYAVKVDHSLSLDIPLEYTPLTRYRATLGHKACHAFISRANAEFKPTFHPRFGLIIGLKATRNIEEGEEIVVDYQYPCIKSAPAWYQKAWFDYLKAEGWSNDDVAKHGNAAHDVKAIYHTVSERIRRST